ncbi:MAG TPA: hypothetical protein VNV18_01935 [Stellaceae bacterium]|jgi:uncharacterized protein (PEP-CTERM system associated)|nr:hypothetical protein [Stellaceae bacterium]
MLVAVAAVERTTPAAAQLATGLAPAGTVPSGGAPSILPPPPSGPFGLPNPAAPPNALPSGPLPISATPPTPELGLPAPGAGITTLQLYDPNAPAVLIQPYATIAEQLTDNVFYTSTNRTADAETRLIPGISISADTPRFRGVLTGTVEGDLYVPAKTLDQLTANLYANGTGTLVPNRLFVDVNSYITQASTLPGLGFISPSQLPSSEQALVFTNLVSPYLRQSFDGLLDTELRYRFGSTNFGGSTGITSTTSPLASNLASGTLNEGTLTAATGEDFQRGLSRLTVDASSFNSNSTSQNTQFSAFDDLEYRIKPNISLLGRAGYQNLQYPFAPEATFAGPTWLAGGRLGSAADYGYVSLEYGRVEGVYGFTGSANYQITPTITFQANLAQGISSPAEFFQTSLAGSSLSPTGAIVDQYSGLPTAFYNPGVGLTNNVYRQHIYTFGLSDVIGVNSYSLFAFYNNEQSLIPPITPPTNSTGAAFTWTRDIRPDLNGTATLGYTKTTNVVTINTSTPVGNVTTLTANVGVNYSFARALTGSIYYSFAYEPNGAMVLSGRSGDIYINSLQLSLTKAF